MEENNRTEKHLEVQDMSKKSTMKTPLIWTAAAIALCALIAGGIYFVWHKNDSSNAAGDSQNTQQATQTPADQAVTFTGAAKKLTDLKLYASDYGPVAYYSAGTFDTGKYKGYTRVVAFYAPQEDFRPYCCSDTFATSDMQSYVLSSPDPSVLNSGSFVKKVSSVDALPTLFTPTVDIGDANFILVMQPDSIVVTLPKGVKTLDSKNTVFKIYTDVPTVTDTTSTAGQSQDSINALNAEKQYLNTTNNVFLQDSTGLISQYTIADKEHWSSYDKSNKKESPTFSYDSFPIKATDLASNTSLYQTYASLAPSICGTGSEYVLNVGDKDLKTVATMGSLQFYALKDPGHALNQAEYYAKILSINEATVSAGSGGGTNSASSSASVQTFAQYTAKNPILMLKDPWGRWIGFGESQNNSSLSC